MLPCPGCARFSVSSPLPVIEWDGGCGKECAALPKGYPPTGGPPPKEMIEFLRGKREAERSQRLAHKEQRAEFAAGCGDTQLDVLEEERGREWVEAGVK